MDPLIQILKRLTDHGVEYVVIGGMAAIAHGSPTMTNDVDVCAPMSDENLLRIVAALREVRPRLRFRPDLMPMPQDLIGLRGVKNLYILTELGVIDLLGEVPGIGTYAEIQGRTIEADLGGFVCRVLDLDTLIAAKRVANRDKDQLAIRHLEVIRKMRREQPGLFDPPPAGS
jgi:predicted nucleotidyltransferase